MKRRRIGSPLKIEKSLFRYHEIELCVVRFQRNHVGFLQGEGEAAGQDRAAPAQMRQRHIIIAAAKAQPAAPSVKAKQGREHDFRRFFPRGRRPALAGHNALQPRDRPAATAGISAAWPFPRRPAAGWESPASPSSCKAAGNQVRPAEPCRGRWEFRKAATGAKAALFCSNARKDPGAVSASF